MYSEIIPWEEVVANIKDDTGLENLTNEYSKIVRSIYRTVRDIGFGGTVLLKRVKYEIIEDAASRRFKLPTDIIRIEEVGMCHLGFCPNTYKIQGNYLFVCDDTITEFYLFYYSLLVDENGRPLITSNHLEAVVAGAVRLLYKPKAFMSEGNANLLAYYEREYEDRVGEARGSDVMPTTEEEIKAISSVLNMSRKDFLIYDMYNRNYCCVTDDAVILDDEGGDNGVTTPITRRVYYWQETNFAFSSVEALALTQEEIDLKSSSNLNVFQAGTTISYTTVGKIIFAIQPSTENQFRIFDTFNQDITDIVFDKVYNPTLEIDFYISKNIYAIGSVYYKIQ